MEPNTSTSGAGPAGNKRNAVKKLLDAYCDLIGDQNGPADKPAYPGISDGQGGPGMPTAAGGVPQKPMLPGLGGGPVPQGGAQLPPPAAKPMPMPQMGQVSMPPPPPPQTMPMQTSMPMPQGAQKMPLPNPTSMPANAQKPAPGMASGPEADIEALRSMYGKFSGGAGNTPVPAPTASVTSGFGSSMKGLGQDIGSGLQGFLQGGKQLGGDLIKTITDHLTGSRQSHMDHEKEILKEVLKAAKERVDSGGSPVPPSMEGHEQDYFDQTSGWGRSKLNAVQKKGTPTAMRNLPAKKTDKTKKQNA